MITLAMVGGAHIHVPGFINTLNNRKDVRVKCVWDHDAARAKAQAEALKCATAELPQIWNDPEIAGVIICSETQRHQPLVLAAAKAKKHMFVEKPLGMSGPDAKAMAEVITNAGVKFQTGYFRRGDPAFRFVRQQIAEGAFGKITRIRGSNCHSGALGGWFDTEWRWMTDLSQSGAGAFGDLGTHLLDIMIWLLGDVQSATGAMDNGTARYNGCEEVGEGLMRFANGAIGTLAASWDDLEDSQPFLLSGTEGCATVIKGQFYFRSNKVQGADGKEPWTKLPAPIASGLDSFLDALAGKSEAQLVTVQEAAYRNAVMDAIYQGASKKTWVNVVK